MTPGTPVREAPASLLHGEGPSPSRPAVPDEPVLAVSNIQGNVLAGFNKDHQTLLFLRITSVPDCKRWLRDLAPFVATAEEVFAFNRLFKAVRRRRGVETRAVRATWINLAISYPGLAQLAPDSAPAFRDPAFQAGLAARSAGLGDPTDPAREGCAANWVVGGPGNEADIVLIVASDDQDDLRAEVARLEDALYAPRAADGTRVRSGVQVIYKQHGATLPPPLTGHEHFGFLDGISQPGLRGRLSEDPTDVVTLRQNPQNRDQGKVGQDLLWPGEFVFGYPGQDPSAQDITGPGQPADAGPEWAKDGSFLVIRRLRQDVPGFSRFLLDGASQLGMSPDQFGAKCVGRWRSGAPVLRAPDADDRALADDDCANNHFEFQAASPPVRHGINQSAVDCHDETFPPSPGDAAGRRCPFAGHIRKAYPRDDTHDPNAPGPAYGQPGGPALRLDEVDTQTHRLLRRGIPFGDPYPPSVDSPFADSGDRGLLFLAYQTSISRQFEFVTQQWVNNPDFKDGGAGHDPILGQNGADPQRARHFRVPRPDGSAGPDTVTTTEEWVVPTGGGYFFAPSLSALELLSR